MAVESAPPETAARYTVSGGLGFKAAKMIFSKSVLFMIINYYLSDFFSAAGAAAGAAPAAGAAAVAAVAAAASALANLTNATT